MMRKLAIKAVLLASPLLILVIAELVLPVHAFTFRPWEALLYVTPTRGFFYENAHVTMWEYSDMAKYDQFDPPKRNEWWTDQYGFRNRMPEVEPDQWDIVVVGDSNIVGSYLDQKDTIAEVLKRKSNLDVYSYAPGSKQRFFSDPRFVESPPKVIVVEAHAGEFWTDSMATFNSTEPIEPPALPAPSSWAVGISTLASAFTGDFRLTDPRIVEDRLSKRTMFHFVRSRCGSVEKPYPPPPTPTTETASAPAPETPAGPPKEDPDEVAKRRMYEQVRAMHDESLARGCDFVFLLMPSPPRWPDDVVERLRNDGVKVVAFLPTSDRPHGIDLDWFYHQADTHWREEAVRLTADRILQELPQFDASQSPSDDPPIDLTTSPSADGTSLQ